MSRSRIFTAFSAATALTAALLLGGLPTAHAQPVPPAPVGQQVGAEALPVAYQAFLDSVGGSRFVTVKGVRMHYVEAGDPDRPLLLLLHGSPDSVYSWRNVMPELARSYHVVAPDLVGFGRSAKPAGPLSWSIEIDYLTGFIDAEHLHRITLVTTDIGGLFGFAYAASQPGNVKAVALWETVTAPIPSYDVLGAYCPQCVGFFTTPKDAVLRRQYIIDNPDFAAQVYGGPGLLHPLSGDELEGYRYFLSTPQQRENVADIGANMPVAGLPADNEAVAERFARYLRTSTVPKLVLYADPGGILPAATAIGLGLPHAQYRSVGAGYHYLVEDAAGAVTRSLLDWRAGIALPGDPGKGKAD